MSPGPTTFRYVPFTEAAFSWLQSGDVGLVRGRGIVARVIGIGGRGPWSHALKIGDWDGQWMAIESREFRGVHAVTLKSQVARYPGRIDVFRPGHGAEEYSAYQSVAAAKSLTGQPYGYWNILLAATAHLAVVRVFTRPSLDDEAVTKRPPFCSQLVSWSEKKAGADPVHWLGDEYTEPADLARSPFYRYQLTLVPDAEHEPVPL